MTLPRLLLQQPRHVTPQGVVHRVFVIDRIRMMECDAKNKVIRLMYENGTEEIQLGEEEQARRTFDELVTVLKRNADATLQCL